MKYELSEKRIRLLPTPTHTGRQRDVHIETEAAREKGYRGRQAHKAEKS